LPVTLVTAGIQSITATDLGGGVAPGQQAGIVVGASGAALLDVSGIASPTTAGAPRTVAVTALDAFGNVADGYRGTIRVTSSDPLAALPANHAFTAADAGAVVLPGVALET